MPGHRPHPSKATTMQLNLIDPIGTLLGPDSEQASDEALITLATLTSRHTSEPGVLAWVGRHTRAVLARWLETERENARLRENALLASHLLRPCAAPGGPHDEKPWCVHGSWPCVITCASWRLSGLDPVVEQVRQREAARLALHTPTDNPA